MELNSVELKVHSKTVAWADTPIIPVGDLQIQPNRELFDEKRFRAMIDWGTENGAYYIGMGDYVDFASPSNRAALKRITAAGELYDSAVDAIDAAAREHLEWVKELLEPTRGRWLGLLEGHHFFEFDDGTTTDQKLAEFLGCKFLGKAAFVEVRFPTVAERGTGGSRTVPSFTIWCHHGTTAGKPIAAPLNQLEQVAKGFDADVYLLGHHHKAVAGRMSRIYPKFVKATGSHRLEHRDLYLACTGSFLKGWTENQSRNGRPTATYAEVGMMNPLALGNVVIWARPRVNKGKKAGEADNIRVDLSVEV